MKRFVVLILACLACLMCGCSRYIEGPEKTEQGEIYDVCFVPEGHGSGMGFTSKGNMVFTDTYIPARYAVVFKCEHGKFVIDGDRGERIYKAFNKGDSVTIHYCEDLKVNADGTTTNAYDLHFLGVEKNK